MTRALGPERTRALRDAAAALVWSRVLVAVVALVAAHLWTGSDYGLRLDDGALTHPLAGALAPLARWDAVWYLRIANDGYSAGPITSFFPLFPLVARVLGGWGGPAAILVASYCVALASFGGALYLLHRLATLELGRGHARATLLLTAFSPAALWFGAPYSESLFLLLSVGAFYAARTDRFAIAGLAAAAASATRNAGVLLLIPLALMWWRGPRRRRDLAWIALAPAGLVAYSAYLAATVGDALAYTHLSEVWYRSFAGPFSALVSGARAAFDGVLQLASGSRAHVYFSEAGGDPFNAAGHNIELFAFALAALALAAGVMRRLPPAYGAYTLAALLLDLSFPATPEPLMSFSRYAAVIFPLFMWLALWCRTRLRLYTVLGISTLLLGVLTARYASWHWVA